VRHKKGDPDSELEYFAISGGVVEISGKAIRVLVDEADHGADITEAESKAALQRAIDMRDNAKDQVELEQAHQLVDRHMVRLKVAELHRRRRRQ
jgi:F-type H+-transporting ATPase subunit epsilon